MANWYTDNITGNDTTGDGTIATPYKTIAMAYNVAANDDTINVAGSGWSAVTGTVTPTAFNISTLTTSIDLTSQLPVGTLISFKDANVGNRKVIYKVGTITATTITLNSNIHYEPGVQYEIEKLTTNYYYSTTINTIFENITGGGMNKTGIKIEGGWVDNFTAQTGITAMVYQFGASGISGTGLRWNVASAQLNPAINNFCFVNISNSWTYITSDVFNTIYLGNLWLSSANIPSISAYQNIPSKACNLHLTASFAGNSNQTYQTSVPFNIDNVYISIGLFTQTRQPVLINNMWQRATSTSGSSSGSGTLTTSYGVINNWYTIFRDSATFQSQAMFSGVGYYLVKDITALGSNLTNKSITPSNTCDPTIQIINESVNVETFGLKTTPTTVPQLFQSRCMARDIEGDKMFWQNTYWLYADSSVYDTGTNSLRITQTNVGGNSAYAPIKSLYIPEGSTTAKTVTVRAKASTSLTCNFGFSLNGYSQKSTNNEMFQSVLASAALTTAWTDYIFTLTSGQITQYAGSYIPIALQSFGTPMEYVWIDSVTIS